MSLSKMRRRVFRSLLGGGAALLGLLPGLGAPRAAEAVTLHAIFLPATWGTVVKNTLARRIREGNWRQGRCAVDRSRRHSR